MNEKILFKIALICSIIGVLSITYISENKEVELLKISDIKEVDKEIKIEGYITNVKETPGLYIIDVKDSTGVITVIIFKEKPLNLQKNQLVEIIGSTTKYKNKIEINAKQIKVV